MTKQTKQAGAVTQNKAGLKVISPIQQIEIIEGAVQAVLDNFSNVEVAKNAVGKIEGGQLGILADALKDYPEPMTEEVWNKMFKANVSDVLSKARINGSRRYANPSSRDVMVNLFKVATMGLTLAKHDRAFAPTFSTATNLKKYAVAVRPMLQTAIDPATGKARLRRIEVAPKEPEASKKLTGNTYYWLIGCEDAQLGLNGVVRKNVVVCGEHDFKKLEGHTEVLRGTYQSFSYVVGEMKPMPVEEHEIIIKTARSRSARATA